MDEFFVVGTSLDDFLANLESILLRCEKNNLVLNYERCHFMEQDDIFLGHRISGKGIEVDKAKIETTKKLPPPSSVEGIKSFLGHAGFSMRFIKDFSKIFKPLSSPLMQGIPFNFDENFMKAFSILKEKLISTPIVVALDWELPFEMMCDTSDYMVGVILS